MTTQPKTTTSLRGADRRRTPGWPLLPFGQFTFWQSRRFSGMLRGPRDCHALRARNDVVIWWLALLFGSGGPRGTARGPFPTVRIGPRNCRETGRAVLLDCRQATSISHEFVSGHWPQNKRTTRGEGGPFIRFRRGGPEPIGRGIRSQALSNLTPHIIAKSRSFDNLWKVKLALDFFRYVWKKKPEFATKW